MGETLGFVTLPNDYEELNNLPNHTTWSEEREQRSEGGGENQRVREHRGRVASRRKSRAMRGQQEVEAGGGARARARRHASASRQRLKTAVPLVGWAAKWTGRVGWASTGEAQVSDR